MAGLLFRQLTQVTTSLGRLVASDLIGLGRFARLSPLPEGSDLSSIHLSSTYRFSRSGPFWALRRLIIIAWFSKSCIEDCSAQPDGPPIELGFPGSCGAFSSSTSAHIQLFCLLDLHAQSHEGWSLHAVPVIVCSIVAALFSRGSIAAISNGSPR